MIYCGALFRPGRPRFVLGAASLFCHGHQSPVTPPSLPHSEAQRPGRGGAAGRGAHLAWASQAGPMEGGALWARTCWEPLELEGAFLTLESLAELLAGGPGAAGLCRLPMSRP